MWHSGSAIPFALLTIALSSACNAPSSGTARAAGGIPSIRASDPTATLTPTCTPELTHTPTASGTFTQTLTLPLPEYPFITLPAITRLQEIRRAGRNAGARAGVFSKVGDSITANSVFLVPFGKGTYDLGEYSYLRDVIDYFSHDDARVGNSFVNVSLAAKSGWRAEDVLEPALAAAECAAGESPLECEYRLVRPAIAVILLGTNDAMSSSGKFADRMRGIVGMTLSRGVIPVLSTLPPMQGKDIGEFNTVVRTLAYDWNIPWIDLYAALLRLPNHGLSPDGVHLSWIDPADFRPPNLNYGMATRNLLTLQVLDAVWKSFPSEEE